MTREEEIAVAFNDYRDALKLSTFGDFEYIDIQEAFEEGAKWADNHPVNVWHDASEKPRTKEWLLVHFDEDNYDTKPSAIDVYRGNTELEITSVNGVPTDSVVVFKEK